MPIKKFTFAALFCLLVFTFSTFGQQQTEDQTTADENFKLNITDKKTTETNYESRVELKLNHKSRPQISVNVGAAVRAEQITVTLKNIFGDVRFRGSLEKILNQINFNRQPQEQK